MYAICRGVSSRRNYTMDCINCEYKYLSAILDSRLGFCREWAMLDEYRTGIRTCLYLGTAKWWTRYSLTTKSTPLGSCINVRLKALGGRTIELGLGNEVIAQWHWPHRATYQIRYWKVTFHIHRMIAYSLQILYCTRPFALCQASMLLPSFVPFTGVIWPLAFRSDLIAA